LIIDISRFVAEERPYWAELERVVDRLERDPGHRLDVEAAKRFHYLYQRASADLARLITFANEPQTRRYLETLVARAYGEIHETRRKPRLAAMWRWVARTFPQTFRRHARAFGLATLAMLVGSVFGAFAVAVDPEAKLVLMPFPHLQIDPAERVAIEEGHSTDPLAGERTTFSGILMAHNTRVAITTLALGITWGIGTLTVLFYNGVILGAVAGDYVLAGQTIFLLGWLMPHGVVELPAVLIAGQAGFVLASALIGWGDRTPLRGRLRRISADMVTLIFGVALLLVWAGLVEAFISQYHEPVLPYAVKIGFGSVQLLLLALYLGLAGRRAAHQQTEPPATT
jgi:uncharacterized membrane protein SpoIIM required for sporulation